MNLAAQSKAIQARQHQINEDLKSVESSKLQFNAKQIASFQNLNHTNSSSNISYQTRNVGQNFINSSQSHSQTMNGSQSARSFLYNCPTSDQNHNLLDTYEQLEAGSMTYRFQNNQSQPLLKSRESQPKQYSNVEFQAFEHYLQNLKAKSFFSLVQNMVSSQIMALEGGLVNAEIQQQRQRQDFQQSEFKAPMINQEYGYELPKKEKARQKKKSSETRRTLIGKENISKLSQIERKSSNAKVLQPKEGEAPTKKNYKQVYDEYQLVNYRQQDTVLSHDQSQATMNSKSSSSILNKDTTKSSIQTYAPSINISARPITILTQNQTRIQGYFDTNASAIDFPSKHSSKESFNKTSHSLNKSHVQINELPVRISFNQTQQVSQNVQDKILRNAAESSLAQDYKLLLKTLRCWKSYVKIERKMKLIECERNLESWALSIHFYEQTLLTKAIIAIQKSTAERIIIKKGKQLQRDIVLRKIKARFFSFWYQKYSSASKNKADVEKALNFWGNNKSRRFIAILRHVVIQSKHERLVLLDKFLQSELSMSCLLTLKNHKILQQFWTSKNLLEDVLSSQIQKRFFDFIPYIAQQIKRNYLRRAFQGLCHSKFETLFQLKLASKYRKKKLFLSFKNRVTYLNRCSKVQILVQNNHKTRYLFLHFLQWMENTSSKLNKREKMIQAHQMKQRNLKFKVIRSFLFYLNRKQQTQSQLKQSTNTNLRKFLKSTFKGWKFMTVYNKEQRQLIRKGRQIHMQGLKSHYFMTWIKTAILVAKSRLQNDQRLKAKIFRAFAYVMEKKESLLMQTLESNEQLRLKQMENIFQQWTKFTSKCQTERQIRRTVFKYMNQIRQRQVFQAWQIQSKSQIQINYKLKNTQINLNKRTLQNSFQVLQWWRDNKMNLREKQDLIFQKQQLLTQQRTLKSWSIVFIKKINLKSNFRQIGINHIKNLLIHYFSAWMSISNNQGVKRFNFFKTRARNILKTHFGIIKGFYLRRKVFKIELQLFLKKRANNLLFNALSFLYSFSKQNEIDRKMRKVSAFIFLEKTLRKYFTGLQQNLDKGRKRKSIKLKQEIKLSKKYFSIMIRQYSIEDKANKFISAKNEKRMRKTFRVISNYMSLIKIRKSKVQRGLKQQSVRLQAIALIQLKTYLNKSRSKKLQLKNAENQYHQSIQRIGFLRWYGYFDLKMQKQKLSKAIRTKAQVVQMARAFRNMKVHSRRRRQMKQVIQPIQLKRKISIIRSCYLILFRYSFEKSILKSSLLRFQEAYAIKQKVSVINAFFYNKNSRSEKRQLNQKENSLQYLRLMKKSLYGFSKNRLRSIFTKQVLKEAKKKFQSKFLSKWINTYNENQIVRPLEKIAELFRLKKAFEQFSKKLHHFSKCKEISSAMNDRADSIFFQREVQRTLKTLFTHSQRSKLYKMKNILAYQLIMKKALNKWRYNLGEIHKDKMRYLMVKNFRILNLERRAFNNLVFGVQIQQNQIRKANQMCYNRNIKLIRKYFFRFIRNVQTQSAILGSFFDRLKVLDRIEMRPKFNSWKTFTQEQNMIIEADRFREERGALYIQRRFFDVFRVFILLKKDLQSRFQIVYQRQERTMKEKFLAQFIQKATQELIMNKRFSNFSEFLSQKKLKNYFEGFIMGVNELRINKYKRQAANQLLLSCLLKKSFVSLQKNHCLGQLCKIIKIRQKQRISLDILNKWKVSYLQSNSLSSIFKVLQENHNNIIQKQFFQRIVKLSFYQQIFETLQSKRLRFFAVSFFTLLKRDIYHSQVLSQLSLLKSAEMKKQIFFVLRAYWQDQKSKEQTALGQLNFISEENNLNLLRLCFDFIRQNTQNQKVKKQAMSVYKHRLTKKAIVAMQVIGFKEQTLQQAYIHIKRATTQKYFCRWIQSLHKVLIIKNVKQNHQTRLLGQFLQKWKEHLAKEKVAKTFCQFKLVSRVYPEVFASLKYNSERKKYLRFCEEEISQNHKFQTLKAIMLCWMDYHNLRKISLNMTQFHGVKLLKSVISEWKSYTQYKTQERCIIENIQQAFYQNQNLYKPLLVIRNVCVYKAFLALKLGTKISNESIIQRNNSLELYYMRLMRKGLYSIKLFASKRIQDKKLRALRNHIIKRRWFGYLQTAIQIKIQEKRKQNEAILYSILQLERKVFNMFIIHTNLRQEFKVKAQFAEELYYKRIADKVLMSLKMNVVEEQENQRLITSNAKSSLVNASMGHNQSRYEQDLSNLQLECSQAQDYQQKKQLVTELYLKKLLYRCFISWGNMALCLSEDGQDDDYNSSYDGNEQYQLDLKDHQNEESQLLILSRDEVHPQFINSQNQYTGMGMNRSLLSPGQEELLNSQGTYQKSFLSPLSGDQQALIQSKYGKIEMRSPRTNDKDASILLKSEYQPHERSVEIIDQDCGNGRNFDDYEIESDDYNQEEYVEEQKQSSEFQMSTTKQNQECSSDEGTGEGSTFQFFRPKIESVGQANMVPSQKSFRGGSSFGPNNQTSKLSISSHRQYQHQLSQEIDSRYSQATSRNLRYSQQQDVEEIEDDNGYGIVGEHDVPQQEIVEDVYPYSNQMSFNHRGNQQQYL